MSMPFSRPGAWTGLVGWSYGAFVAAHWANRNPDRTLGAILVDGAFPYDWLDDAMEQRIRKMFRRLNWFMPLLRPTGLTPRMTAEQQANSNIEIGKISRERELGPVLDNITVPARYVVASGTSFGSKGDEQERIRASLQAVIARNPNIRISAKVASNHGAILKKDAPAIGAAVREVAALDRGGAEDMISGLTISRAAAFAGVTVKTVRHHPPARTGRRTGVPPTLIHPPLRRTAKRGAPSRDCRASSDVDEEYRDCPVG